MQILPLCYLHLVAASRSYTCAQDGVDTVQLALVVFFLPPTSKNTPLAVMVVIARCNLRWWYIYIYIYIHTYIHRYEHEAILKPKTENNIGAPSAPQKGPVTALELGTYALSRSFSHASHGDRLRSLVPHRPYVPVTGVPLSSDA